MKKCIYCGSTTFIVEIDGFQKVKFCEGGSEIINQDVSVMFTCCNCEQQYIEPDSYDLRIKKQQPPATRTTGGTMIDWKTTKIGSDIYYIINEHLAEPEIRKGILTRLTVDDFVTCRVDDIYDKSDKMVFNDFNEAKAALIDIHLVRAEKTRQLKQGGGK